MAPRIFFQPLEDRPSLAEFVAELARTL